MNLSRHDLNRVNIFKNNILNANKMLYYASKQEVIDFFNSQDDLIKDIKDLELRNKLLAESKYVRVKALSNHEQHSSTLNRIRELTLNDGIYEWNSEKEVNDYFDLLDQNIEAMPTDKVSKDGLFELSKEYRQSSLEKLKNR